MPNLQLINSHYQNILKEQLQSTLETCNCLKKEDYRMNGLCLTDCLLYYATIICDKENYSKLCKGTWETTFKKHQETTKSPTFQPTKAIPNFLTNIALLKQSSLTQKYLGKSKGNASPTILFPEDCNLCLNEKLEILDDEDQKLLNKQSEIISHCCHQNNFKLKFLAPNTGDADIT